MDETPQRKELDPASMTIAALATDPSAYQRTGQVVVAAQYAEMCGIKDVDGKRPRPLSLDDV